jgi:hypothetical protein
MSLLRPVLPENAKIAKIPNFMVILQSTEVAKRAAEGQHLRYDLKLKWQDVAKRTKIIGPDGSPSPGLAKKIIDQNYEPARRSTRIRLGFSPICPTCHQKVPQSRRQVHFDPRQMDEVVAFLAAHEITKPVKSLSYNRMGKLAAKQITGIKNASTQNNS